MRAWQLVPLSASVAVGAKVTGTPTPAGDGAATTVADGGLPPQGPAVISITEGSLVRVAVLTTNSAR